jgi:hypothetical protein
VAPTSPGQGFVPALVWRASAEHGFSRFPETSGTAPGAGQNRHNAIGDVYRALLAGLTRGSADELDAVGRCGEHRLRLPRPDKRKSALERVRTAGWQEIGAALDEG